MIKQFNSYAEVKNLQINDVCIIKNKINYYDVVRCVGKHKEGKENLSCLAPSILTLNDAFNIADTYARIGTKL